jgi:omega-6 fatty acid desaturase (delta-12 desaturase)
MSKPQDPASKADRREAVAKWKAVVAEFQQPNHWRASWQILNSVGGYAALWVLMYFSLSVSWWLTMPLAILAGALLVRNFIIFHDCGHGSFFKSSRANNIWGFVTGVLTFTPYYHWRWEHSVHHASSGHLDRRGMGDIWTLTVNEYLEASKRKRFVYRLTRNPFILLVIAPAIIFLLRQRIPLGKANPRERRSVWLMNLALLVMSLALISIFGFLPWMIIQLTTIVIAGSCGVWLFYVQHQYEETYWVRGDDWDFTAAAMEGSSFYKLPKVLQWFSGNIGYHHIHHLSPRISNYNLERCHRSHPMFQEVKPMTLFGSLKSLTYRLWDENSGKLVGFRHLKTLSQE